MRYSIIHSASVASLATLTSAALDKPIISPEFPGGGLDSLADGLNANLPNTENTYTIWNNGYIPQDCKTITESAGFSAADVETIEITYNDCSTPWQFCRHKDSPLSEQTIVDTWGKVPVGVRSYVRHMVFVPGDASAGSNGDNVQMNGDLPITVFFHESGHSLDSHAYPDLGQFSMNQIWLDAYNADSAVPDAYSQTSQQENFAQEVVVATYAQNVPEGLGPVQPNYQAIQNAYSLIQSHSQSIIVPGGTCTARLENSPPVSQTASAKMRPTGPKPDVSLSKGVKVIEPIPMKDTMEIHQFKGGKVVGQRIQKLNV